MLGRNFLWEYYGEGFLGCGPMFISYALSRNEAVEYIGVGIMCTGQLKKYRDAMRSFGIKTIGVVRASAESLPFRRGVFICSLS
jgi:hypothetical protein